MDRRRLADEAENYETERTVQEVGMNDQKWFSLRGEQYMNDGNWWVKSGNNRFACPHPFRVGDWVKVSQPDGRLLKYAKCEGPILELCDSGRVIVDFGSRVKVEPSLLEPADPSTPDYIPPAGWRVKGDDEVVADGDAFSHWSDGTVCSNPNKLLGYLLTGEHKVSEARQHDLPNGGYILTPIVSPPSTPQQDVSSESQDDDRSPLGIYLPEIERKVNLAAKDRPEILDWWRAEKERLAIEAGKLIGGGM